jgi:hypothetical protein
MRVKRNSTPLIICDDAANINDSERKLFISVTDSKKEEYVESPKMKMEAALIISVIHSKKKRGTIKKAEEAAEKKKGRR